MRGKLFSPLPVVRGTQCVRVKTEGGRLLRVRGAYGGSEEPGIFIFIGRR